MSAWSLDRLIRIRSTKRMNRGERRGSSAYASVAPRLPAPIASARQLRPALSAHSSMLEVVSVGCRRKKQYFGFGLRSVRLARPVVSRPTERAAILRCRLQRSAKADPQKCIDKSTGARGGSEQDRRNDSLQSRDDFSIIKIDKLGADPSGHRAVNLASSLSRRRLSPARGFAVLLRSVQDVVRHLRFLQKNVLIDKRS